MSAEKCPYCGKDHASDLICDEMFIVHARGINAIAAPTEPSPAQENKAGNPGSNDPSMVELGNPIDTCKIIADVLEIPSDAPSSGSLPNTSGPAREDGQYSTIARLADLSQTTVGYQGPVLVEEAVRCWRELTACRAELADVRHHLFLKEYEQEPMPSRLTQRESSVGWNDRGIAHPDDVFGTLPGEDESSDGLAEGWYDNDAIGEFARQLLQKYPKIGYMETATKYTVLVLRAAEALRARSGEKS